MEIKFRYRLRLKNSQGEKIYKQMFTLAEVEQGVIGKNADIVAREMFTCAHDKHGNELYEGDKIKYYKREGVVKWDDDKRGFALYTESDNTYVHFSKFVLKNVTIILEDNGKEKR